MYKRQLAADVSLEEVAVQTTGFTGADLATLVNEAALLAGRENRGSVDREHFIVAIERTISGLEKKRSILRGTEKETVAKHEVGHALVGTCVAKLLPGFQTEVEKLSIVPRTSGALGFTYMPPGEDRALTVTRAHASLSVCLVCLVRELRRHSSDSESGLRLGVFSRRTPRESAPRALLASRPSLRTEQHAAHRESLPVASR